VLGPGLNPYGTANSDGVYVWKSTNDVTLKNCRIYGTLVVVCPGKKLVVDGSVLLQPISNDFPALIVDGDIEFRFSSATALSEATVGINLNPAGAPYQGQTDTDKTDTYPSEIQGLVHCTGDINWTSDNIIRGAVISEGTDSSDAFKIDTAKATIVYDGTIYNSPPQFYTSQVKMIPQANSYKQVVK
jgi:hypothetical protein